MTFIDHPHGAPSAAPPEAAEVLLRPAVELYTVAACAGAAFLSLVERDGAGERGRRGRGQAEGRGCGLQ